MRRLLREVAVQRATGRPSAGAAPLAFCGQRNADGDFIRPFTAADLAKIEATQAPVSLSFSYSDADAFKALQREAPNLGIVVSIAGAPEDKKNVSLPPLQKSTDGDAAQAQESANR